MQRPCRGKHGEFSTAPAPVCSAQQSGNGKFVPQPQAAASASLCCGRGLWVPYWVSVKHPALFSFPKLHHLLGVRINGIDSKT